MNPVPLSNSESSKTFTPNSHTILFPRTRAWTRAQRLFIIVAALLGLMSFGGLVYSYERYHRGPTESVFYGTWIMEGCMDCTNLFTFEPNHDVIAFGDYMGLEDQLDYRGRWYAGGEFLMIRYVSEETSQFIVLRIQEITPNAIRVLWDGKEMRLRRSQRRPPLISNQIGAT